MTNRKTTRDRIGYTHQKQLENSELWYNKALSFNEASMVLYIHKDSISSGIKIFQYNAALSLELIFKAIMAKKSEEIPQTHKLRELCKKSDVELTEDQKLTLDFLTESIYWLGRYPVPKTEKEWDNFHDNIAEKLVERSRSVNSYSILGNRERFPTIENYKNIWRICLKKYGSLKSQNDIN